jgi:DNA gyrase subunit B
VSALGCGIGNEEFNPAQLRYGKVVIMTDADVDGSHIRTLLLTFFYRHMKPLIDHGHVFVAQPPLYLVARKKHKEYVLDERKMRRTLTTLGLDGTRLEVRDSAAAPAEVVQSLTGADLERLIDLLDQLADKIHILERRGLDFPELMANRKLGRLPTHWVVAEGLTFFCHGAKEYEEALARYHVEEEYDSGEAKNGDEGVAAGKPAESPAAGAKRTRGGNGKGNGKSHANGNGNGGPRREQAVQKRAELHEVRDIEKLFDRLRALGLSVEDYFRVREESVTGEKEPAKYVLLNEEESVELDNISQIAPGVRQIGSKDIEIKRFKGLGEMNADELWETTMDPNRRVLLRVRAEEAEEAERMFSLLMGDDVARRRQFIEEHALEVKNLDV